MEFKGKRAELYCNLEWATQPSFIDPILDAGRFRSTDRVLDVGTGTGIMAKAISPLVKEVIGLDISDDMLSRNQVDGNITLLSGDIRYASLPDQSFDKVIARQVFHHILKDTQLAMDRCFRVLRLGGGLMILAEGVPPTQAIKSHYEKVFALKEERIVFMEEDLVNLLRLSGFRDIQTIIVWQKQMSIRNWLVNSGLPQETQDEIFQLYPLYFDDCVKAYGMTARNNDYFIDMKQAIVVGTKISPY